MKRVCVLAMIFIMGLSACSKNNSNVFVNSQATISDNSSTDNVSDEINNSSQKQPQESKNESPVDNQQNEDSKEQSSVKKHQHSNKKEDKNAYKELSKEDKDILSIASKKNKSELITETYSEEKIFKKAFIGRHYNAGNSFQIHMSDFGKSEGLDMKIECLRIVDEDHCYSIHKTKENGYIYCFFRPAYSQMTLYNSCYIKETLTYDDFKNLKVGDSIENVKKIDSAFSSMYDYNTMRGRPVQTSHHLLKDGFLIIRYENEVVTSIEFNEDFTEYNEYRGLFCYKINEEDYP